MKVKLIVMALMICLMVPAQSHAFGILRYLYDAVSNQLGLDRGPIPKVVPNTPNPHLWPKGLPINQHPDTGRIHIQAEGF